MRISRQAASWNTFAAPAWLLGAVVACGALAGAAAAAPVPSDDDLFDELAAIEALHAAPEGKAGTATARFTVEAGRRRVPQGGSVTVPVLLNNVDALANMNVHVYYDATVVRPAGNAARGNLVPRALFEANVRDRGVIRLGFAQKDDVRGTGTLAQLAFEAVGKPGDRTPLRLEVPMAAAAAGQRLTPAKLVHGEITIVDRDGRLPGDRSGTGTLTALDAMNALKMSVGNLPVDLVADVDGDRRVTSRDATIILQRVVRRN